MFNATPQSLRSKATASSPRTDLEKLVAQNRQPLWQRLLIGSAFVALGISAVSIGASSIFYHLTHMSIRGGLVNGRTVRIQAPVDGKIKDFYARPGATVRSGQVLALVQPLSLTENGVAPTSASLPSVSVDQTLPIQLATAQQRLSILRQQAQELEQRYQALQATTETISRENLNSSTAAVEAAIAQEMTARSEYNRFRALLEDGAVSQQRVEQLESVWRSAQSAVVQAQSEKNIAQAQFNALKAQTPLQSSIEDLQTQKRRLLQEIQAEAARIQLLESEFQIQQVQTSATPVNVETNPAVSTVSISAPFDGVVYNTRRDTGEQVSRPNVLLSLLDCKDLWVEALVSVEQAKRIDVDKPVRVQLASDDETVVGEVEFVNAISNGTLTESRAEALLPAVPASLVGQPIARVRVSIPPNLVQDQSRQFCGVGQSVTLTFGTPFSL